MESLEISFRNAVRGSVKIQCKLIMNAGEPSIQAKKRWKFENSADWHYGHFVGMMEALASSTYFTFFGKPIGEEKMKEVEEIIEEESKELREYFKKNFKD